MSSGIDLTGMACSGMLMSNEAMQPEIVVVGDWSLAEMYNMRPEQPAFRALKQHIRLGVESKDTTKLHLAFLLARNSESGEPGQPLTEFIVWTTDLWNSYCDRLGGGVVRAHMNHGFMVGGLVAAFAAFLNGADSGLLIRMQDVLPVESKGLVFVDRTHEGPIPTSEVIAARFLKIVVDTWPSYRPENPAAFRVLQSGTLTDSERQALYSELWGIMQGKKPLRQRSPFRW